MAESGRKVHSSCYLTVYKMSTFDKIERLFFFIEKVVKVAIHELTHQNLRYLSFIWPALAIAGAGQKSFYGKIDAMKTITWIVGSDVWFRSLTSSTTSFLKIGFWRRNMSGLILFIDEKLTNDLTSCRHTVRYYWWYVKLHLEWMKSIMWIQ